MVAAFVILAGLSFGEGGAVVAQEKNKFERQNEKKNKSNRRLKRRGDKGKSNNAKRRAVNFKSRTRQGEKSYKGDITGRKVITKTTSRKSSASHAQPNPYAGRKRKTESSVSKSAKASPRYTKRRSETAKRVTTNPRYSSKGRERAWKGTASGRAIKTRSKRISFTGKSNYQGGSYQSISRPSERAVKSPRIRPRSASGNYNVRKRNNPYAFRQKKAWEKSFKGDITGRTFRTKRTVERPVIQKPAQARYSHAGRKGDSPYSGGLNGGFKTATKKSERAWKKDISGNKLRIRTSTKPTFRGPQFQTLPAKKNRKGDLAYKGKIKRGKIRSVSSRKEVAGQKSAGSEPPGEGTARGFRFQGNIKAQKPLKGGGSISGKLKNNQGRPIQGRGTTGQDIKAAKFLGNIKTRKPLKGGGSISGRSRNNGGRAIQGRGTTGQDIKAAKFLGNIKAQKPLKGGGSVARNNWNNRGKATTKLSNNEQNRRTRTFQGNIKLSKPAKGGGTLNVHPWNNKGTSVNKPIESVTGRKAANFKGNTKPFKRGKYDALASYYKGNDKRRSYTKNPNADKKALKVRITKNKDNSSEFKGNVKPFVRGKYDALASYYKGDDKRKYDYRRNPNSSKEALKVKQALKNDRLSANFQGRNKNRSNLKHNPASVDDALRVRKPGKNYFEGGDFQGRTKVTWNYKQNPSANKESLKNIPPTKATSKASNFQGRYRASKSYTRNPYADKEALKGIGPSKAAIKGSNFQGRFKAAHYSRNPYADKEALKGIGPSRAAINASNYQGNIKMNKRNIKDRHPSMNYARGIKSSTQEKEKLFSIKLMFSKIFRKNENQPDNLKEKIRRPRFDKREKDIWYD